MDYQIDYADQNNVQNGGVLGTTSALIQNVDGIDTSDGQFMKFLDQNGQLIQLFATRYVVRVRQYSPTVSKNQLAAYGMAAKSSIPPTTSTGTTPSGPLPPVAQPVADPFTRSMKGVSRP